MAHVAGPQHIKVRVIGSYLDPNDNGTHIPYHNYSFFHVVAKFAVMRCLEESGQKACKMLIEPIWYWLVASFKSSQVKIILHVFKSANFFFFCRFPRCWFSSCFLRRRWAATSAQTEASNSSTATLYSTHLTAPALMEGLILCMASLLYLIALWLVLRV